MTNEITEPLRLAIGSHKAGSGKGCALNVISWENGDSTISDFPPCSDRLLARIVQRVNDVYCRHTVEGMLCPSCSVVVLALAHRTVGTGDLPLTTDQRHRVWVGVAADLARAVQHLAKNKEATERAITSAEVFANGGPKPAAADAYADADAYAYAAAAAAVAAAAAAAAAAAGYAYAYAYADGYAAADAYAAAAGYAYAYAAVAAAGYAAADAYADADADGYAYAAARLRLAHRAINKFEELTGHIATPVAPEVTAEAVRKMVSV